MAFIPNLIGDAAPPYTLIRSGKRLIDTIIPDIVVEEIHNDRAIITEHPVATGAPISDHVYLRPPEVVMRCGFSNSTAQSEGYVQEIYQEFLSIQSEFRPFFVMTGKRPYNDMLISDIAVNTDQESEFALQIAIFLRGVIITDTSASKGPSQAAQADPQKTSPVMNNGTQQLQSTAHPAPAPLVLQ